MGLFDIIFGKKNKEIKEEEIITLGEHISNEIKSGKSPEKVKAELLKDLHEGGELFGNFKEQTRVTFDTDLDRSENQLYYWSGIDDKETCEKCKKMQEMEPRTWTEWEKIGLPGDEQVTCGFDCRCDLVQFDPEMALIESLNPLEEKAFKTLKKSKENPQKVIETVELLCTKLLEIGKEIEKTEELQIYFWIDNLTIAFVRIKDYTNAHKWLKIADNLPDRYKQRSNNTEQERINKRYIKCSEKINS